jgi:hypothetical protein
VKYLSPGQSSSSSEVPSAAGGDVSAFCIFLRNTYCHGIASFAVAFILRLKEEQERALYAKHMLYVGVRRDWTGGSKILLVKKGITGDVFAASGIFEKIVELDAMDQQERKMCLQNNWYGRMMFERIDRFLPPVPVQDTPLTGVRPALLHGLAVTEEQATEIDSLVASRIIS